MALNKISHFIEDEKLKVLNKKLLLVNDFGSKSCWIYQKTKKSRKTWVNGKFESKNCWIRPNTKESRKPESMIHSKVKVVGYTNKPERVLPVRI